MGIAVRVWIFYNSALMLVSINLTSPELGVLKVLFKNGNKCTANVIGSNPLNDVAHS